MGVAGGRPRGGMACGFVRGVWGQAFILHRLPVPGTGSRGPLPTCCGGGRAGVETRHWLFCLRALLGVERRGAVRNLTWGGKSRCVRGLWC